MAVVADQKFPAQYIGEYMIDSIELPTTSMRVGIDEHKMHLGTIGFYAYARCWFDQSLYAMCHVPCAQSLYAMCHVPVVAFVNDEQPVISYVDISGGIVNSHIPVEVHIFWCSISMSLD